MLEEEQVQELYDNITKALKDLPAGDGHFRTVYDAQLYVLEKVLQN